MEKSTNLSIHLPLTEKYLLKLQALMLWEIWTNLFQNSNCKSDRRTAAPLPFILASLILHPIHWCGTWRRGSWRDRCRWSGTLEHLEWELWPHPCLKTQVAGKGPCGNLRTRRGKTLLSQPQRLHFSGPLSSQLRKLCSFVVCCCARHPKWKIVS